MTRQRSDTEKCRVKTRTSDIHTKTVQSSDQNKVMFRPGQYRAHTGEQDGVQTKAVQISDQEYTGFRPWTM